MLQGISLTPNTPRRRGNHTTLLHYYHIVIAKFGVTAACVLHGGYGTDTGLSVSVSAISVALIHLLH